MMISGGCCEMSLGTPSAWVLLVSQETCCLLSCWRSVTALTVHCHETYAQDLANTLMDLQLVL